MASIASLRRQLLSWCCILFVGVAYAADQPVLLVVGDSLASGYRINVDQSWPVLLERRLQASGRRVLVINASRKGETSEGGRKRLKDLLVKNKPRWVILELGANDGLRRLPLESLRNNLRNMLAMVLSSSAVPIVVGMQLPPGDDSGYADKFAAVYVDTARENDIPFVPFLLKNVVNRPELFLADHLHPNADAQPLLLEAVWAVADLIISPR